MLRVVAQISQRKVQAKASEEIKCSVDPYIDDSYSFGPALVVSYTNIYDFLICSSNGPSCDGKPANAFKSLDGFRMVCAKGWMSTLQTKV